MSQPRTAEVVERFNYPEINREVSRVVLAPAYEGVIPQVFLSYWREGNYNAIDICQYDPSLVPNTPVLGSYRRVGTVQAFEQFGNYKLDSRRFAGKLEVPARWTPDCQGKEDFDGHLVRISTRYWPDFTAHAAFHLYANMPPNGGEYDSEYIQLVDADFKGESRADCQRQVELWAQAEYEGLVDHLRLRYPALKVPKFQ